MKPAVRASGLAKEYLVGGAASHRTLYEMLTAALAPSRAGASARKAGARFWALQGIDFEIQPGEVVGVIGRNGAGKSTLLKILSRITAPTRGRVEIQGRLASLLEVGTGFHHELTGRENIFLNGAILGMSRTAIARRFDEIVDFAEVGSFIDTPVKHYSSGMYVRLAFAVAAHLETDVLVVDEVLAVGDASFQRKSIGKMSDVAQGGRTVLFVSHNLAAVRNLCTRTLMLEGGQLRFDGPTHAAVTHYESSFAEATGKLHDAHFSGELRGTIEFEELRLLQGGETVVLLDPTEPFALEVRGTAVRTLSEAEINIAVFRDGVQLATCFDSPSPVRLHAGSFLSRLEFPAGVFHPGRYTLGLGASSPAGWIWGPEVAMMEFAANRGGLPEHRVRGALQLPYRGARTQ